MNSVHSEVSHLATEYSYLSKTVVLYRHTLIDKIKKKKKNMWFHSSFGIIVLIMLNGPFYGIIIISFVAACKGCANSN